MNRTIPSGLVTLVAGVALAAGAFAFGNSLTPTPEPQPAQAAGEPWVDNVIDRIYVAGLNIKGNGTVTLDHCENIKRIDLVSSDGNVMATGQVLVIPPSLCQFKFKVGE
jgi:hypothetical protein